MEKREKSNKLRCAMDEDRDRGQKEAIRKRLSIIGSVAMPFSLILLILCIWELFGILFPEKMYYLPPPSQVIVSFFEAKELLLFHAKYTLIEAAVGFLFAFLVSVMLALLIDHSKLLKQALYPLL